jgi:hypothetical protein
MIRKKVKNKQTVHIVCQVLGFLHNWSEDVRKKRGRTGERGGLVAERMPRRRAKERTVGGFCSGQSGRCIMHGDSST